MTTLDVQELYGLRVASQLPLHVDRPATVGAQPDVVVTVDGEREVPDDAPEGIRLAHFSVPERSYYTFVTLPDGDHVLRFHGTADFVVSADLTRVRIYLAPGIDRGLASVLVSGMLMSFLLLLQGHPLLHASAVDLGESAVAFVGYSGKGKSTMATLMCAAGARIITDDVLRLDLERGTALCRLGATEARLRKSASDLARAFDVEPESRRTSDERDAVRLDASIVDRLPLAAIVVPEPRRDVGAVELLRLPAAEALLRLSCYPRIVGWEEQAVMAAQFQLLADVVERVPVFVANVPWGPPFAPEIPAMVLQHIGLSISHYDEAVGSR
ncbi:MAG: hypothetical protein ACRDV3_10150 [Acidothermaceae bacterium]